jgi:hypothetical protein
MKKYCLMIIESSFGSITVEFNQTELFVFVVGVDQGEIAAAIAAVIQDGVGQLGRFGAPLAASLPGESPGRFHFGLARVVAQLPG